MPLYEYSCSEHGRFDYVKSIHDPTFREAPCPSCGTTCEKVLSVPQHRIHTLDLQSKLPKGADAHYAVKQKKYVEEQIRQGSEADTYDCLPELKPFAPDPSI